jgi:3-dehydrosphinganine reductase
MMCCFDANMLLYLAGLAECLRSEFQLYDISIHAYFPGTILSPGYQEENKTKPEITKKLEGPESDGLTPEQCARGLLKGESLSFSCMVDDVV